MRKTHYTISKPAATYRPTERTETFLTVEAGDNKETVCQLSKLYFDSVPAAGDAREDCCPRGGGAVSLEEVQH